MAGRDRECAELAAAVEHAARGTGRAVLVLGEAGMGKSTVADWLLMLARDAGFRCARAGCSAAGMPALWPWRRALAGVAGELPWQDASAPAAQADRQLLAAAVVDAVASAAREQPLLVVLEDLHWADPATLLVARAVADAIPALPVMLVLTSRDDPADAMPDSREQLAELSTGVRRMLLPPLDPPSVAALAASELGSELPEQEVRELSARTGGNPFFVREVLRLRAAHGADSALVVPRGVREVLERRIARLSQPCATVLGLAAVAAETSGDVIETDLLDAADPGSLLDEAVAAQLLDGTGSGYRFRHALIREVIEGALPGAERGRLHAAVARRLEQRVDPPPSRLAYHWSCAAGAGAAERAGFWSLRAARAAMSDFGFEAAAGHFRRALATTGTDRIAVSVELGEALQLAGDTAAARNVLLDAADAATAAGRPVDLAAAALAIGGGLAGFEVPISDDRQAGLLERADAAMPAAEVAMRAAVRGRLSLARAGAVPLPERIALAEDAVRLAGRAGDPAVESAVLAAYCDAIAGPDYVARRIAAAERMVELIGAGRVGALHDRATALLARRLLLVAHLENGDLAAADEQALAYEHVAARLGIPLYGWLPEIWRGMRALLAGDPDEALRRADAAADIGRRAGSVNAELMVFTVRLQAHLDRGTPGDYAADVRAVVEQLGPLGMPPMYLAAPARLLLAAGDAGPARSVLRAFRSGTADSMPKDAEWLESQWSMADLAIDLDDRTAADGLYEALLPYADLWAVDGIGGAVFGTIAEQVGRLGRHLGRVDADRHLAVARERYARQGTPALLARLDAGVRPAPAGTAAEVGRLHRDGATWQLEWRGRRSTVPDAKGLHDLAILVRRPGRPVPAVELVEAAGGPPAVSAGADLGPVLDETARRAYRRRLDELDRDLADAEQAADLGHVERLRAERGMIVDELAAAVGLGSRPRIAGDPADRARKAVTMRIRAAVRAIEAQDEALARHLRNAVRTGRLCSYEPEAPVTWLG
jgi:hypothetical protein